MKNVSKWLNPWICTPWLWLDFNMSVTFWEIICPIIPNHFYFSRPWCQAQTQSRWHSVKWEQQFSTNNLRSREAQNWSKETRNNFATEPFTKGFPVFESFCSGVFVRSKYFVTIYIKLWQLILSDLSLIICIYKNCSEIQNPSFASFEL